jgi:hypothetical protein
VDLVNADPELCHTLLNGLKVLTQMEDKYYTDFNGMELGRDEITIFFDQTQKISVSLSNFANALEVSGGLVRCAFFDHGFCCVRVSIIGLRLLHGARFSTEICTRGCHGVSRLLV